MGSLPPAKAGVGSAMNDTTRQMGGALGVAVLGSVFATIYRPGMADELAGAGLTGDQLSRAQDSIGGALQVAAELPDRAAAANVIATAKQQFVDGMHLAIVVAIAVVLLASLIVFMFLPARAHDHAPRPASPDDDVAIAPLPPRRRDRLTWPPPPTHRCDPDGSAAKLPIRRSSPPRSTCSPPTATPG
jgi:hypothetical protein